MVILLMKSSSLLLFLLIFTNFLPLFESKTDQCSGRWQMVDKLNIKVTFDWQILPETNLLVTEFRTNQIARGFWYGFSLLSSSQSQLNNELVYAMQWRENKTEISWEMYNITESEINRLESTNDSSLITFQRSLSSGLLTVRSTWNNSRVENANEQCRYFVYMRGHLQEDQPLLPDEIHFNRSLCLTYSEIEVSSTMQDTTTDLILIENTTNGSMNGLRELNEDILIESVSSLPYHRAEYSFIWFGRIVNRTWSKDYTNLHSLSSRNLRLDLENLFLYLLNHNSSSSFICNQFELYSLQSGSILFASNITLISNLSEEQTIETIEQLIKPINTSFDSHLHFDRTKHQIKRTIDIVYIDNLFKNLSRTIIDNDDHSNKRIQPDPSLYLLVGSIVGIGGLMVIITTMLCLYGYYKCRRREFRLHTERQTFKFRSDIDSYRWLGQQPSTSSSSPYLIQSTSI